MNRRTHLESLREKLAKASKGAGLESLVKPEDHAPVLEIVMAETVDGAAATDGIGDLAEIQASALRKLDDGDFDAISRREEFALEAIVEVEGRQVTFVQNDRFVDLPDPWTHFNTADSPIRRNIERAIPSIGRIEMPPAFAGGRPTHLGTGFIVGPDLILTNRHVAALFARGLGSGPQLSFVPGRRAAIDFRRERDFRADDVSFNFDVSEVAMIHPYWDMALLRLEASTEARPLELSTSAPEDLLGREIAVIGYPGRSRDRSSVAVELERKYFGDEFGVKRLAPGEIRDRDSISSFGHTVSAMTHDSSTLPGNSGAAIVDVLTGEVVGLHFAGITLRANYAVSAFDLARDRRVVAAGVNFRGSAPPTEEWESFWRATITAGSFQESPPRRERRTPTAPASVPTFADVATLTIPLTISLRIGGEGRGPEVKPSAPMQFDRPSMEASFQVPVIHPDLENRDGYDPDYLTSEGGDRVPLPALTDKGHAAVARLDDGSFELKYAKFSIAMHKKRRLALFTAANVSWRDSDRLIDGRKPTRKELTGIPDGVLEEWVTDPRIAESDQLPDLFFTKDGRAFDKGHLVRRDDVAWGRDFRDMQRSNGDTYHTTNCSPQVGAFNQSTKGELNWGDLEDLVRRQTRSERVIVVAGPALSKYDRTFLGVDDSGPIRVKIPSRFWKIVVAADDEGTRAFGFVLKQSLEDVPLEFAVPEDWAPFHVPIREIEELTYGLLDLSWFASRDAIA